jgi:hypothetical protein
VIFQRHCTVEKQRAPGGRAQAISYLEDASKYETNIFAYS